jgi:hypothetical protein
LIHVDSDLFGAPLGGDVLGAGQLRPPTVACEGDEILGDHWHRASRALLPRRVGRRVDDNLTDDSPTSVMRVATRNKKPRERIGHSIGSRLGGVDVQMPQCGTDVPAVVHRPGQFPRGSPRLASFIVDSFTVAGRSLLSARTLVTCRSRAF